MRLKSAIAASLFLASCATTSSAPDPSLTQLADPDASLAWSRDDFSAHREAFLRAFDAPANDTVSWVTASANGAVLAKEARIILSPEEPLGKPGPLGLRVTGVMEMDLGAHIARSKANVRLGPSTDDKAVTSLSAGARVDVVGRLVREPWSLVARDGRVLGYVFADLLEQPAGARSRLAGARLATPVYCRALEESAVHGEADSAWRSLACKGDGGVFRLKGKPS